MRGCYHGGWLNASALQCARCRHTLMLMEAALPFNWLPLAFPASSALRARAVADFWALPPPMVTCRAQRVEQHKQRVAQKLASWA